MKFCINCGNKAEDEVSFCVTCGEPFSKNDSIQPVELITEKQAVPLQKQESSEQTKVQRHTNQTNPKKPLSRKSKILLGISAVIIAIGFITNIFMSQHYDGKKLISKMHNAYVAKDKELFYTYFEIPENTVGGAEEFYKWINEKDWPYLREEMITELGKLENGYGADPIDIVHSDALQITKEKVFLGLFEKTVFRIQPLEVSVSTDFEGTTVTIAGEKVKTTEEDTVIGNFIPGTYEMSYNFDGPYTPITGKEKIKLMSYDDYQYVKDIEMDYTEIDLDSDYEDAIVYINDVSTKKTVGELERLYPVVYSDDVKVHLVAKNASGKDVISKKYPLTESYIEFEFEADKELALIEEVKDFYDSFRNDYATAIYNTDFYYVEDYFPQDVQIAKDYKKFIEDHKDIPGYDYNFTLNEVKSVNKISETEFQLTTNEEFDYSSDEDGELSYSREKSYKISYSNEEFKILEIKDLNTKKTKK